MNKLFVNAYKLIRRIFGLEESNKPMPNDDPEPNSSQPKPLEKSPKRPREHPGKRGKHDQPRSDPNKGKKNLKPKPELICREDRRSLKWEIVLSLPEGCDAKVSQGNTQLKIDENKVSLQNFTDDITIQWANGEQESIKLFNGGSPLIFKIRKNWQGVGRQVKRISNGFYIVIVPKEWVRLDKQHGGTEAATSIDANFCAHYFTSDRNDGFQECDSFFAKQRFFLYGKEVEDDSDMGPLFTGDILELKDTEDWRNISYIRVGEEGGHGWGKNVEVTESMPKEIEDILEKSEGWFYIRIYDDIGKLIDSLNFRKIIGLKAILRDGEEHSSQTMMIPNETGYENVVVQFTGENISVERKKKGDKNYSKIDNNTTTLEPCALDDTTHWRINEKTEITIRMPRIWWHMDKGKETAEWRAVPFEMLQEEFLEHRNASLVIRLPLAVQKVPVGFDSFDSNKAKIKNEGEAKEAEVSLQTFAYDDEINQPLSAQTSLRIQCELKEGAVELPLIHILANKTPPEQDNPSTPPEQDNPPIPLPPQSIYRPDKNKGFSKGELHQAGFSNSNVIQSRIACDRRRRTIHLYNIEKLCRLKGEDHAK